MIRLVTVALEALERLVDRRCTYVALQVPRWPGWSFSTSLERTLAAVHPECEVVHRAHDRWGVFVAPPSEARVYVALLAVQSAWCTLLLWLAERHWIQEKEEGGYFRDCRFTVPWRWRRV